MAENDGFEIRDYDPDDPQVQAATRHGETCRHPDGDQRDTAVISGQPQGGD